jgi:membrane protein implicated in regulation of membrane protease activity
MSLDQAVFLGIALFGALFLLISFVIGEVGSFFDGVGDTIGDHLDIGGDAGSADVGSAEGSDDGPSPLSLRNMMAFLTAYGASGLITSAYGWSTLASSLFAVVPGVALAFVAYRFMKLLYGQQSSSLLEMSSLVGHQGIVDLAIPAAGLGRVTVNTNTGQSTFIARGDGGSAIATGERVVVEGTLGSDLIVKRATDGA